MTNRDLEELKLREAIGDCCCCFYDRYGKIIKGDLSDRTIGIPLDFLKTIPTRLGIARGKVKTRAIHTVLKYRYINS